MQGERRSLVSNDDEAELLLLRSQIKPAEAGQRRRWPPGNTLGYIALGQLLSVLVCITGVFSKRLSQAGIVAPTAQSFATYAMLGLFWSAVNYLHPPQSDAQAAAGAP